MYKRQGFGTERVQHRLSAAVCAIVSVFEERDGDLLVGSDRWMAYSMIYLSGLYLDRVGSRRKGV